MTFTEILQTLRADGASYLIDVTPDWGQGRATFGGLVTAVANEALRQLVPRDRPLRSLQTTFVGPATAGTWRLDASVLRVGKAVTIARCDVIDGEQVAATIVGVYGGARPSAVNYRPQRVTTAKTPDEIREVQFKDGGPQFIQHFAARWAEGAKPFSGAARTPTKAFIRHREPQSLTESHIVALVDCIPTPAMSMFLAPAPSSSLVWTLEFIEHRFDFPSEAWWRIDTEIDAAGDGYVNQTGVLNDPEGTPVALTRQLFAVFG